ncbi:MAG: hypothetical protein CL768_00315 [Chloroflexi bacterium]|nr:hypothetical protein [Chloroflexota bacterium]|tara:strand:+ start:12771 stop:13571 length:801 start_codon:yes stop_codon:yes gene_type:complete
MILTRIFLTLILLLHIPLVFSSINPIVKEPKNENPKAILMIGNSFMYYNNGVHNPLVRLIRSSEELGKGHKIRSITINGSSLSWHDVSSYIKNPNLGSFSINSKNVLKKYNFEGFDMAIMQDCSQCPIHPERKELFHDYVAKHSNLLKNKDIEPVLMMTWAYKDKPEMADQLSEEYTRAGNKNGILVLPVGLAYKNSMEKYPEIDLYHPDKRHPSKAGTYLSACVMFTSVFKTSPVGNPYTFDLESDIALKLQRIAWLTHQQYYEN